VGKELVNIETITEEKNRGTDMCRMEDNSKKIDQNNTGGEDGDGDSEASANDESATGTDQNNAGSETDEKGEEELSGSDDDEKLLHELQEGTEKNVK
jgi:hypothetical protein